MNTKHNSQQYLQMLLRGLRPSSSKTSSFGISTDFAGLSSYVYGDDVRFIDWAATARQGSTIVRRYYDEKSFSICCLFDISASMKAGYAASCFQQMVDVAQGIIQNAIIAGHRVGVATFNSLIRASTPLRSGASWGAYLNSFVMQEVTIEKCENQTSYDTACSYIQQLSKDKCVILLFSDLGVISSVDTLALLGKKHDIRVVCIASNADTDWAKVPGGMVVLDAEEAEFAVNSWRSSDLNKYLSYQVETLHAAGVQTYSFHMNNNQATLELL